MRRSRILLMSRTLRRDLPSCYVLKKILEAKSRASVVVCSQRSVFNYLRHWRPQALVYPCCGDTPYFAPYAEQVKLYCYSGEGGESSVNYDEKFFMNFPEYLDKIQRILLWGKAAKQYLLEDEEQMHGGKYRQLLEDIKIRVVGHPRLDLAFHFPKRTCSRSIGICTHFFTLNNFRGDSALRLTFGRANEISALEFEVELLGLVTKIVDYLVAETDYKISIRPYPLEAPQMYSLGNDGKKRFYNTSYQGRVSIDDHLDFAGWASEQELILSSVTTALGEAYLMGVPMLFINKIMQRNNEYPYYNQINQILGDVAFQPSSFDELKHYLQHPQDTPINMDSLFPFLNYYYNIEESGSALERVADIILSDIMTDGNRNPSYIPAAFINARDWANFFLERVNDPLCGNFNYLSGYHSIPDYYNQIADNILTGRTTLASRLPVNTP